MVIPAAVCVGLCVAAIGYQWSHAPTHERGIVVADATMLLEGNGDAFTPTTGQPLQIGGEFELVEQRDKWLRVRLADGQTGWIAAGNAELINSQHQG